MNKGVFSSLKVLDFSRLLPGPFASMMLADMGADVLRIESPTRWDMTRSRPPFDEGISAGHALLNRNKRSLALDLKIPEAVDVVKKLIFEYDIVLEQFRPGVMKRLGVDYEALAKVNPNIIYCSLTGYGQTGPLRDRAGHDNNYLALSGVMSHSGRARAGPVPQGVQVADLGAGTYGVLVGILGAVIHRMTTGEGQYIDVSMLDGALHWNAYAGAEYLVSGNVPEFESMVLNGGSQYDYYETRDGRYMSVGSLEPQFWQGLCDTIGHPEWRDVSTLPGPDINAIKAKLKEIFKAKDFSEWCAIFEAVDLCVEPVLNLKEATSHPQAVEREMLVDVPKPSGETQRQIAFPIKFSKAEARYDHVGSSVGAHTHETLAVAGYRDCEIEDLRRAGVFGPVAP